MVRRAGRPVPATVHDRNREGGGTRGGRSVTTIQRLASLKDFVPDSKSDPHTPAPGREIEVKPIAATLARSDLGSMN